MTDRALIRIARAFRRGILGKRSAERMCFVVCLPLEAILSVHGVEARAEELTFAEDADTDVANHAVLRLADGRILDPTADQFGLAEVYLGPMPELYREWTGEIPFDA